MSHNAAFHQGLHCLLRLKGSSEREIQFLLEIIIRDPSIYTMNHTKLIASYQVEEPIRIQRVNTCTYICVSSSLLLVSAAKAVPMASFSSSVNTVPLENFECKRLITGSYLKA